MIIPLVLACSGCTTYLQNQRPYKDYVRKDITLKRPALLYEREYSNLSFWSGSRSLKPGDLYEIGNVGDKAFEQRIQYKDSSGDHDDPFWGKEYPLAEGTTVFIKKMYSWVNGSGYFDIRAEGVVFVDALDRKVPFVFTWGQGSYTAGHSELKTAPWEDEPSGQRLVNPNGTPIRKK